MGRSPKKGNNLRHKPLKGGFSLQNTHVLKIYNVLPIHGWSEVKPGEKVEVVFVEFQRKL